jgi:hypothetical protein
MNDESNKSYFKDLPLWLQLQIKKEEENKLKLYMKEQRELMNPLLKGKTYKKKKPRLAALDQTVSLQRRTRRSVGDYGD